MHNEACLESHSNTGIMPRLLHYNESYALDANLSETQKSYRALQGLVRKLDPKVTIITWTGPPDQPFIRDRHLVPVRQVRMGMYMPMDRKFANEKVVSVVLEDHPEYIRWPHRHHFQQVQGRLMDGDLVFGGPGSLIGDPVDATRYPRSEHCRWNIERFGYTDGQTMDKLIAPNSGFVVISKDDLYANIRIGGKLAFRFDIEDIDKFSITEKTAKAGCQIGNLLAQVSYRSVVYKEGYPQRGGPSKDELSLDDHYMVKLAMACMRAWDIKGTAGHQAMVSEGDDLLYPRRMIEIPDASLLDSWNPTAIFLKSEDVKLHLLNEGIDSEVEDDMPGIYDAIFRDNYVVKPGKRGYEGKGVLVDWRLVGEEIRSQATRNEWLEFSHMRHLVEGDIGGYVVAVDYPNPSSISGIRYETSPLFVDRAEENRKTGKKSFIRRPKKTFAKEQTIQESEQTDGGRNWQYRPEPASKEGLDTAECSRDWNHSRNGMPLAVAS
jgi:hypothetical protein